MRRLLPFVFAVASIAAQEKQAGDFRAYLGAITLPGSNTESFRAASDGQIAIWRSALDAAYAEDWPGAAREAARVNYRLIEFTDSATGRVYFVFRENDANRTHQGTYVLNPAGCRKLVFQAPHAGGDTNTLPQSIHLFLELDAYGLFIAGTHRCANAEPSTCDGRSTFCTGRDAPYPVSDVAHFTRNFFQPAHEQLMRRVPNAIAIQMHGFAWDDGDPDVMVSNATCRDLRASLANQLSAAYNRAFARRSLAIRSSSCNEAGGADRLCAQSNVQARFTAGTRDPCGCTGSTRGTCFPGNGCEQTMAYPERFLHIEQSCALRQMTCTRPARLTYQDSVEIFAQLFPCFPKLEHAVVPANFRDTVFAPGGLLSVFGSALGGSPALQVCGRRVAPLASADTQVNAVIPEETTAASCELTAVAAGEVPLLSNTLRIELRMDAVTPFERDGLLLAQGEDGAFMAANRPLRKGEMVTMWATGGVVNEFRQGGADSEFDTVRPAPGLLQIRFRLAAASLSLNGRVYELRVEE